MMNAKKIILSLLLFPFFLHAQDTKEIEQKKKEALIYYNIAMSSDKMGNYDRAVENFLKAHELDSITYADAYSRIGNSFCNALKYREALPYFQKHLEKFPHTTESQMNMGNTYYVLEEYEKAITFYEKTLAIDSTHRTACRNMGNSYYNLKNNEKYLKYFKKAARLGDSEIQNWLRANGETW